MLSLLATGCSNKSSLESFAQTKGEDIMQPVNSKFQFNGFTEYWQNLYENRISYGNLFRINVRELDKSILKAKVSVAEDLGIPGLQMQEGFLNGLFNTAYELIENPSAASLNAAIKSEKNIFVIVDSETETGKKLLGNYNPQSFAEALSSYQAQAEDFTRVHAFILSNSKKKLYVVASKEKKYLDNFKLMVSNTEKILAEYDLKKGWFGAQTLIKSVTCTPGTPIELIGKGMNEGNSWFVFDGYMEFLAQKEIENWVSEVNLPVVTDVGFSPIYGCENYDELQVQSMFTPDAWIKYAKEKKGYVFTPVYNPEAKDLQYDGYIAHAGNIDQINNDNKPFIASTGSLINGATTSMVVFNKKNEPFTKAALWNAIINKREVAVLEEGKMMGPALYRNALQLLLLDRIYLETYFNDRVNINAFTKGNKAYITIINTGLKNIDGNLTVRLPKQLSLRGDSTTPVNITAGNTKELVFDIEPSTKALGRPNAIYFEYNWGGKSKLTVALMEPPPAISVHELLYGSSSGVTYPISVYNFSAKDAVAVKVAVAEKNNSSNIVFEKEQTLTVPVSTYKTWELDLKLPPGSYTVNVSALGVTEATQLGIESSNGAAKANEVDLNNDGISEYNMENDHVRVTLLTTGARVIEYIVKSKNDNLLFKLWPEKPVDDRRPYRNREFYPYGGFEDFLGQPSIETHKVYDAEVVKKEGAYVQVKMKASYYGNVIEKIFTLYGNSPLLEIRFALSMKNAELSMLGPQPILEIGKVHGPEDKFIIPEMDGLKEYRMMQDKYYGRAFFINEGWNAGYDTKEDISFAGAFPVKQPIFLHMWMNHPVNPGSHYYYAEFQPWTPLFQNTTTYFSYYMWGAGGGWEQSVKALRDRNLITVR
ncbi:hypothetical protein [Agriterribacter sp.]|uniref:COG1470 family protein n=1 Tax=Agriterribacter sp. TaxID=2821509 RepID=UPI002D0C6249|nr:hypothetical protein [Agriterribacter sp.]HTN08734.1 hypothetical protein [Agriterribacter sp.]